MLSKQMVEVTGCAATGAFMRLNPLLHAIAIVRFMQAKALASALSSWAIDRSVHVGGHCSLRRSCKLLYYLVRAEPARIACAECAHTAS